MPVTVDPVGFRIPNIYAGDLAESMVRMLERPVSENRAYNLAGSSDISYWQLMRAFRSAGGKTPGVVLPLPVPFVARYNVGLAEDHLDFENRSPLLAFQDALAFQSLGQNRILPTKR